MDEKPAAKMKRFGEFLIDLNTIIAVELDDIGAKIYAAVRPENPSDQPVIIIDDWTIATAIRHDLERDGKLHIYALPHCTWAIDLKRVKFINRPKNEVVFTLGDKSLTIKVPADVTDKIARTMSGMKGQV